MTVENFYELGGWGEEGVCERKEKSILIFFFQ